MIRLWTIIGIIGVAGLILFFIYNEGENKGKVNEVVKQQEQQIEVQNEIIEEKKQIQIRKVINKSIPTSSNIDWLRKNRCKDCQGR